MIWFTARMAERSAYLLFEPHPHMKSPTTSSEETARTNTRPISRSASAQPRAKGMVAYMRNAGTRKTIGARL